MSSRRSIIIGILLVALPVAALIPVTRLVIDWLRYADVPGIETGGPPRGFDWVEWNDEDGAVTATFVFPSGSGHQAGIRENDVLYELDDRQFFSSEDLQRGIAGITPGERRLITVQRDSGLVSLDLRISSYPTFLYPLSTSLWYSSIWGFALAAFLHLLALVVVLPMAGRSGHSRRAAFMILAAALWICGNLARLSWLELIGPPDLSGPAFRTGFTVLTLTALAGWLAFPVLLLNDVLLAVTAGRRTLHRLRWLTWFPPVLLLLTALAGGLGWAPAPLSLSALIGPLLFYVTCYIAGATGLVLYDGLSPAGETELARWKLVGNGILFVISLGATIAIPGNLPLLGQYMSDVGVGWFTVGIQLLSVAPVGLVSFDTLRLGKLDSMLVRSLAYVAGLGLVFFVFTGAIYALQPYEDNFTVPESVLYGLVLIVILAVGEFTVRMLRPYTESWLLTERQRARRQLAKLSQQIRGTLEVPKLALLTINATCPALNARSGLVFLKATDGPTHWISASFHPEPPFLTDSAFVRVWPHFEQDPSLWSSNPVLDEKDLPDESRELLKSYNINIAAPVVGERGAHGMILLGAKTPRRLVYNVEDLETLRSVCSQLALAIERIQLLDREKELVRISAEAQLVALRAQINPHFLFNTLNTIASLIEESPTHAERTVEHLSAIFRHILQTGSQPFVSLNTEMSLVRNYLSIEKARFGERLHYEEALGADAIACEVPAFSVQTLVENAVLHGIAGVRSGGTIRITSSVDDGGIVICVQDTGRGISALFDRDGASTERSFFGTGLTNVAERLTRLYERDDLLTFASKPWEGTTATIRIPAAPRAEAPMSDNEMFGNA